MDPRAASLPSLLRLIICLCQVSVEAASPLLLLTPPCHFHLHVFLLHFSSYNLLFLSLLPSSTHLLTVYYFSYLTFFFLRSSSPFYSLLHLVISISLLPSLTLLTVYFSYPTFFRSAFLLTLKYVIFTFFLPPSALLQLPLIHIFLQSAFLILLFRLAFILTFYFILPFFHSQLSFSYHAYTSS